MCDVTDRSRLRRATPRPRWGLLYGLVALMLGVLAAAESLASPGVLQTSVGGALALAGFAAVGVWVRSNRGALEQQSWCACAGATVTVRVIPSRRPEPERIEEDEEVLEEVAS